MSELSKWISDTSPIKSGLLRVVEGEQRQHVKQEKDERK